MFNPKGSMHALYTVVSHGVGRGEEGGGGGLCADMQQ